MSNSLIPRSADLDNGIKFPSQTASVTDAPLLVIINMRGLQKGLTNI